MRSLQGRKELQKLVQRVKSTRDSRQWGPRGPPPLLIKIAPDLTDADKEDVAAVALRQGVDGLIVSNTTISRPAGVAGHPCGDEVSRRTIAGTERGVYCACGGTEEDAYFAVGGTEEGS